MNSHAARLHADDGAAFSAYLARPFAPNGAGIVLLQEIFGVNANMRSAADQLAAAGFTVIVPDLFWRQEAGVELNPGSESDRERAVGLMKATDTALAVQDALTAARYVGALDGACGRIGAVGYCFGGKLAYLLSMEPGIHAAVSYYGTGVHTLLDQMERVSSPLLLHIAGDDHMCPANAQKAIALAAAQKGDVVTVLHHSGVGHGLCEAGR
jgi:carboxymethylenebutenolidase